MLRRPVKCRTVKPHPRNMHRAQVDRLLNPKSGITLSSLQRTVTMAGRRLAMIELV